MMPPAAAHRTVSHEMVQDFYRRYETRDVAHIEPLLDDDIEWTIAGPVDLLEIYGTRHGKAAVLDFIARVAPAVHQDPKFELDEIVVHGDRAATLFRFSAIDRRSGRRITYRAAHLLYYRNGKLISLRAISDSFNAARERFGYMLPAVPNAEAVPLAPVDDIVAM
jgi:ketosteroid isomerase-like protein